MKTDALARRLRYSPPVRKVRRLVLTPADHLIFEAIQRHGPLPTNYLYEFSKHERQSYLNLQHRLTEFYNGDDTGPYLTRPPAQFDAFAARYQPLIYDLAPRAKIALAEYGSLARYSDRKDSKPIHQFMGACVGASIELIAKLTDFRYIGREEILAKAERPLPVQLRAGRLVPDDLFGISGVDDQGDWYRFFAIEIDRNTESIERRNLHQTSFGQKVAAYREVLRDRLYRSAWGIPNLSVLTVTTNATHAANLLAYVARDSEYQERFAFAVAPAFGSHWRVPREVLAHLVEEPWQTAVGPKFIDR
ncbi:MAG TPA: hypothetical protein VFW19_02715 [Allosphingosinicella sp.]|nr:hypothetical protein [Allosphingosinicella sp.]